MRTLLVMATMLMAMPVFGMYPIIKVENISGQFENNKGSAFAESAKYDLKEAIITHKRIDVDFYKPSKNLVLSDDNTSVQLNFDFSFMNVFKAFHFEGLNIESDLKHFNVFAPSFVLDIEPNKYTINEIEVDTDIRNEPNVDQDIDILQGFLLKGELNVKSILFGKLNQKEMIQDFMNENPTVAKDIEEDFSKRINIPLAARNLRLVVKSSTFSGSVLLDSWINATLYLGGKTDYNKKSNQLTLTLLKAKLGYFSIRKFLLKRLAKMNIESVKVNGSNIVIDLGKTVFGSGR
jgi:hypothetical protein